MVKFGKHKFKALNKLAKNQKLANTSGLSNKILKKKINADKKVTFQKEILLNELPALDNNTLVKNVTAKDIIHSERTKISGKKKTLEQTQKPKQKPVEKHKKRQKTQINDTKLLLSLMKKSK
ncbi:unnamed protein product [Arctia plantaginis]|uniref:Uncharacterized protein n=1 Tax=Arctia plantaginis TaxID=874455 RepID=A0A8S0ZH59_ARCPL|nr:unnamed protein product [Arctia plantaginis]